MFSVPSFNETEERLKSMIERACRPGLMEPDLALNLEICDLVNEKQKNYPRLAAFTILDYINARNTHVGLLGLELLDNCVKNCGHPFHLQIASKDFLNDLVKYFPKQQSTNPSSVQLKILELIKEWKKTICVYSRHKEDLTNISNMFSLLRSKGYRFPRLKRDVTAVMNPTNVLKSADELEEEDRLAQSAKLQELIRRGRPEDLAEANELMKIMSGYDTSSKPDYKEEVNKELEKIEGDVQLFIDMLNNLHPEEKISETVMEFHDVCKATLPKVQRLIHENEEEEELDRLLTLNDRATQAIERFNNIRKGIYTNESLPGINVNTNNADIQAEREISLIDLEDIDNLSLTNHSSEEDTKQTSGNPLDDLLGISFESNGSPGLQALRPQAKEYSRGSTLQTNDSNYYSNDNSLI